MKSTTLRVYTYTRIDVRTYLRATKLVRFRFGRPIARQNKTSKEVGQYTNDHLFERRAGELIAEAMKSAVLKEVDEDEVAGLVVVKMGDDVGETGGRSLLVHQSHTTQELDGEAEEELRLTTEGIGAVGARKLDERVAQQRQRRLLRRLSHLLDRLRQSLHPFEVRHQRQQAKHEARCKRYIAAQVGQTGGKETANLARRQTHKDDRSGIVETSPTRATGHLSKEEGRKLVTVDAEDDRFTRHINTKTGVK